ncbi:hypothetical protein FB451DRAFT_1260373 [Mycena latifolia]|nr:hypothetical protein FB451DRAFT_1260373 [Mycena latifolia]
MLHWKEFSAWVTIDGKVTPELNAETSEEKTVTCWIASELGKRFAVTVHWENSAYHDDTLGYVKMDGNRCGGRMIYCDMVPLGRRESRTVQRSDLLFFRPWNSPVRFLLFPCPLFIVTFFRRRLSEGCTTSESATRHHRAHHPPSSRNR